MNPHNLFISFICISLCIFTLSCNKSTTEPQSSSTEPVVKQEIPVAETNAPIPQPNIPKEDTNIHEDAPIEEDTDISDSTDNDIPQNDTIEEKMSSLKWESAYNTRFEFDYEFPSFMKTLPPPANNDGLTYQWKDMFFLVWGSHDVLFEGSAQKAYDFTIQNYDHKPHYKVVKSNYYIISDYTKEGNIFYMKCILKNELEYCMEVEYPKDYKDAVDPIVKKIAAFDVE